MKLVLFVLAVFAGVAAFVLREYLPYGFGYVATSISNLAPSYVNISLFQNGMDTGNTTYCLLLNATRPFTEIQRELAEKIYPNKDIIRVEIYNEIGGHLTGIHDFINNMGVYVAIDGELFMHPGKYVGFTKKVSNFSMVTLSLSPRVFLVKDLLSEAECDEIVAKAAADEIHRSVVYQESGEDVSNARTSSTAYVNYPDILYLMERAYNITKMPNDLTYLYPDYELQVIHYHPNQHFHPHHDGFFAESVGDVQWFEGGKRNRYLTLFLYLNNVDEGGETAFIEYDEYIDFYRQADKYDLHSNNPCDKARLSVTPSKGDAILFYNLKPGGQMQGEIDWNAVHSGCGVKKGEKWACNVWMYNRPTIEPEYIKIMEEVGLLKPTENAYGREASEDN